MAEKYKHDQGGSAWHGPEDNNAVAPGSIRHPRRNGLPVAVGLAGLAVLTFATPLAAGPVSKAGGGVWAPEQVHLARVIVRKGQWIEVQDEPLLGVINELNRHSKRKLLVNRRDPRLRRLKVTGRFRTDRPEALVQYIRSAGIPVWAKKDRRGNIVLRLRGESSSG